jgi:hypothetical protein
MVLRVSKWSASPKRGYVVLGDIPVDSTEQDLATVFSEHLPATLQLQLYDPDTNTVSRTFSMEVAQRSPLEQLAETAKTWAPLQDIGSVRSWKKRMVKYLNDEVAAMLLRPMMYAQNAETLAFGVLQNRMYVEQISGRRRDLTRDLHKFGCLQTNRPGAAWWHTKSTVDEAAEVLRKWIKEIE